MKAERVACQVGVPRAPSREEASGGRVCDCVCREGLTRVEGTAEGHFHRPGRQVWGEGSECLTQPALRVLLSAC